MSEKAKEKCACLGGVCCQHIAANSKFASAMKWDTVLSLVYGFIVLVLFAANLGNCFLLMRLLFSPALIATYVVWMIILAVLLLLTFFHLGMRHYSTLILLQSFALFAFVLRMIWDLAMYAPGVMKFSGDFDYDDDDYGLLVFRGLLPVLGPGSISTGGGYYSSAAIQANFPLYIAPLLLLVFGLRFRAADGLMYFSSGLCCYLKNLHKQKQEDLNTEILYLDEDGMELSEAEVKSVESSLRSLQMQDMKEGQEEELVVSYPDPIFSKIAEIV